LLDILVGSPCDMNSLSLQMCTACSNVKRAVIWAGLDTSMSCSTADVASKEEKKKIISYGDVTNA